MQVRDLLMLPVWAGPAVAVAGAVLIAVAATLMVVGTGDSVPGDSREAFPKPTVGGTSPESTNAGSCPVADGSICDFADELESWLNDWKELVVLAAAGSSFDHGDGYSEVLRAAREAGVANTDVPTGEPSGALVTIGCPASTGATADCQDGFALAFSSLTTGVDPGPGEAGIFILTFNLNSGEPLLSGFVVPVDRAARRTALNGGFTNVCDVAGNPPGSNNPQCASAMFFSYPRPWQSLSTVAGIPVESLRLGLAVDLPAGLYYFTSGCWGCDGGGSALHRAYFDGSGALPEMERLSPVAGETPGSVAIDADGSRIAAVICDPHCSGIGTPDPDTAATIYLSTDGGVTWSVVDKVPGLVWIRELVGDEVRATWAYGEGSPETWDFDRVFDFPSRTLVETPDGEPPASGTTVADGTTVHSGHNGSALLRSDGSIYWQPIVFPPANEYGVRVWAQPESGMRFARWIHTPGDATSSERYIAVYRGDALERVFRSDINGLDGDPSVWTGEGIGYGSAMLTPAELGEPDRQDADYRRPLPALVDYMTGTIAPVEPEFVLRQAPHGRLSLVAFAEGAFLQVNAPGDCLNIRSTAGLDAAGLTCAADGVLLGDRDDAWVRDGTTWLAVRTPDGEPGWAAAEYLR